MSKINIFLDNYHGRCYAGSVISGRLECYFAKPKKIREITIKCEGKEKTEWTETESYRDERNQQQTRYQTYTGDHEIYLNRLCLVKTQANEEIPAGTYHYPFSFLLPENLPSTYDCEYGHIIYTIKAVANRPWKFDYVSEITLMVESPIDLNKIPNVRNSFTLSDEKNLCCLWCKSGPISILVAIPHSGFAPGETVSCAAYIKNLSNVNVKGINLELRESVEYKVEFPSTKTKERGDTVASAAYGTIGAHGEHNFTLELTVPENFRIPNFSNCVLFKARYNLTVEVKLPCPHVNLTDTTSVAVGNIKLDYSSSGFPQPLPAPSAPTLDTITHAVDNASLIGNPESIASAAPPSYEQATQGIGGGLTMPMPMPMLPTLKE